MPTPLDRAMQSRNAVLGFAGFVAAAAAWTIFGGDMFPKEPEPTGDPDQWTEEQMRRWLDARGLLPSSKSSREELVARIKANLRAPRS